jgi:hypothetical protein
MSVGRGPRLINRTVGEEKMLSSAAVQSHAIGMLAFAPPTQHRQATPDYNAQMIMVADETPLQFRAVVQLTDRDMISARGALSLLLCAHLRVFRICNVCGGGFCLFVVKQRTKNTHI